MNIWWRAIHAALHTMEDRYLPYHICANTIPLDSVAILKLQMNLNLWLDGPAVMTALGPK